MQLILHAPFGGRINKAWGLALRKRFCRGFNFELQAAATDNGLNISLAEQHSFPLTDVFQFLTTHTVTELLEQASLASPIFKTRLRWDATRSLQLLRFQKGKKIPPQIQRTRGEDLLASVFPQAAACFENIEGDIEIPDHPLVSEVMNDVLGEAMDLAGLTDVIAKIQSGEIRCVAVDTTVPSSSRTACSTPIPTPFSTTPRRRAPRPRRQHARHGPGKTCSAKLAASTPRRSARSAKNPGPTSATSTSSTTFSTGSSLSPPRSSTIPAPPAGASCSTA